ncbi:hypothetical protein TrVE_jg8092 [Triparma verrucosa]|uniref:RanBP2-type domain-containing protein n=1 Tax=Triparma verrucosa TaxID=1606542 RepID=A0A9W7CLC1_9STRA|nr:hypothetical protein TrVE_jg8092 [Triparma verrucosa]
MSEEILHSSDEAVRIKVELKEEWLDEAVAASNQSNHAASSDDVLEASMNLRFEAQSEEIQAMKETIGALKQVLKSQSQSAGKRKREIAESKKEIAELKGLLLAQKASSTSFNSLILRLAEATIATENIRQELQLERAILREQQRHSRCDSSSNDDVDDNADDDGRGVYVPGHSAPSPPPYTKSIHIPSQPQQAAPTHEVSWNSKPDWAPEWTCPACKESLYNFRHRVNCFSCSSPNPGLVIKRGDWTCPSCNSNNFPSRRDCFICSTPKLNCHIVPGSEISGNSNSSGKTWKCTS